MSTAAATHTRKASGVRTRGGCLECRRRRRKCGQEKPNCQRCIASGSTCNYAAAIEFRDVTVWAAEKVIAAKATKASSLELQSTFQVDGQRWSPDAGATALHIVTDAEATSQLDTPSSSILPVTSTLSASIARLSPMTTFEDREISSTEFSDLDITNNFVPPRSPVRQVETNELFLAVEDNATASGTYDFTFEETGLMTEISEWVHGSNGESSLSATEARAAVTQIPSSPLIFDNPTSSEHIIQGMVTNYPRLTPSPVSWGSVIEEHQDFTSTNAVGSGMTYSWQPQLPSLPRFLSSTPSVPVQDRLYLAHFASHCVNLLPAEVHALRRTAMAVEPVRLAAMALGAAHLAHLQGMHVSGPRRSMRWVPKSSHINRASLLAAQAIQATYSNTSLPRSTLLGVALFLCYYQLEAGTLDDLWSSVHHLDMLVLNSSTEHTLTNEDGLMQGWSHIRSLSKRVRPLTAPTGVESRVEHVLCGLEERFASSRRVDTISIMAARLMFRVFLCKCMGGSTFSSRDSLQDIKLWWNILQGITDEVEDQYRENNFDTILNEDQAYSELRSLSERLQKCDMPHEFPVDFEAVLDRYSALDEPPAELDHNLSQPLFQFSSHDQAMDCASYAFAHIACDHHLLQRATSRQAPTNQRVTRAQQQPPLNPWLALLQHIALGLDITECARRNTYRMGIITQLLCGALICSEPRVLDFIARFLRRILVQHSCREDALTPLHATLQIIMTLQREFARGRRVFICSITYNSCVDKKRLFSSCENEFLIILGRDADGTLFNDCVSIMEEDDDEIDMMATANRR